MRLFTRTLQVHGAIYERTDGRLGHRLLGVPTILLRTTGRKTGRERTSALVYARDGEDFLIVASNGGADRPPAKNRYATYRTRTDRPIPAVVLTPHG